MLTPLETLWIGIVIGNGMTWLVILSYEFSVRKSKKRTR